MNLSLNMIVGQKPEMYLEYALKSTKWVDEKIIVNTGDKENPNLQIIKNIVPEAKILHFSDTGLPFTFSNARNYALQNSSCYWILWQDADEIHFDEFKDLFRSMQTWIHYDGFRFGFYHFLLDVFHFQHIEPRTIIFKKDGRQWQGDVHEQITPLDRIFQGEYKYHHYGYTKPQHLIYENWKLYWQLNIPENYKLQEHRNPDDIISDRVTVANEYHGSYPQAIQEYIKQQIPKVKDYKFV